MAGGGDKEAAGTATVKDEEKPKTCGANASSYWQTISSSASYAASAAATTVKGACVASYGHTLRAAGALPGVVYASGAKIASCIPDVENRDSLSRAITGASRSAAFTALDEATRLIPGAYPVWRVAKSGSSEFMKNYGKEGGVKLEGRIETRLLEVERKLMELERQNQRLMEEAELRRREGMVYPNPKPEDVLQSFICGGFKGRDFLDQLMFSKIGVHSKEEQKKQQPVIRDTSR